MNKKAAKEATIVTSIIIGGLIVLTIWVALTVWMMNLIGGWMIAPMLLVPGTVLLWFMMYDTAKRDLR